MNGPLSGFRVLDLSNVFAGPFGAMLLGDLGAEVIKVEPPTGEVGRNQAGPRYKGESSYYLTFNRNKKSVVLDLRTKLGKEAFYDLVRVSHVVWNNFRPGAMERMEIGYDTLKEINPSIIYCSITGYGETGPYRDRPSYDVIAQGMSGIMSVTGAPDGPPLRTGPSISDASGGLFAALAVATALASLARTGKGQKIELSLLGSSIAIMAYHFSNYFCSGVVLGRIGSGHQNTVPFGGYRTRDGYITIGAAWPRIARTLGLDWMIDDPRFSTGGQRLIHRDECNRIIEERLSEQDSEFWLELFKADDIAAGPIYTVDKVVEDPQVKEQGCILTMKHPLGGEIRLAGNPIKMPGSINPSEYLPPPTLGQHTDEVLAGLLGYSEEKIQRLKQEEKEHTEELATHIRKAI